MRLAVLRTCILAGLAATLLGCGSLSRRPDYPDDPLLICKKPVKGEVEGTVPVMVAYAEPRLPTLPNTALVSSPPLPRRIIETSPSVATVPAIPVSRQKSRAATGHAQDHSWLQGVVGSSDLGGLELRYADSPEEDALGGKVLLENDPRLAQVKIGDVIRVEGTIVKPPHEPTLRAGSAPQVYRIREMWLVGRKN